MSDEPIKLSLSPEVARVVVSALLAYRTTATGQRAETCRVLVHQIEWSLNREGAPARKE